MNRLRIEELLAGAAASRAGGQIDDLGTTSARSSRAIAQPRDELGRFAREGGDADNELGRLGGSLDRFRRHLNDTDVDLSRFGHGLRAVTGQMHSFGTAGSAASGMLLKWGGLITALSGPMAGLLALGPVALFGGLAAGAHMYAANLQQAAAAGQKLTATQKMILPIVNQINQAFHSMAPFVHQSGQILLHTFAGLVPVIKQAAHALGPMLPVLARGLGGFVKNMLTPMAQALQHLMPVVKAFSHGLAGLGGAIGNVFKQINPKLAAQGLNDLFRVLDAVLGLLPKLLNALAPIGHVIISTLLPPIMHLANAVVSFAGKLGPVLTPIAHWFGVLINVVAQVLHMLTPLLPVLGQLFGSLAQLDTPIERLAGLFPTIVTALKPFLGLVAQIAGVLTGFLNQAITALVAALTPIIPIVGQVLDILGQALLQALQQLLPALLPLIPALGNLALQVVKVLPSMVKLAVQVLPPLVALLKLLIPVLTFLIKLFTPIAGWLVKIAVGFFMLNKAIEIARMVWLGFTMILEMNPFIAIATAIVVAVLLIIKYHKQLWEAIVKAWNAIKNAVETAMHFVVGIVKHWWPVIIAVFTGGLSLLIGAIIKWHAKIVAFFSTALSWLVHAGKAVVTGLWNGIKTAAEAVWGWMRSIGSKIKNFFSGAGTWLWDAGKAIIGGLIGGIKSAVGGLTSAIGSIGHGITGAFHSVMGIFSPSRVMANEVGSPIVQGIAKGMIDNAHVIDKAAGVVGGRVRGGNYGQGSAGLSALGSLATGAVGSGGVYIDLRGSQVMSDRDMDLLVGKLGKALATRHLPRAGVQVIR